MTDLALSNRQPILRLRGIVKRFPGVLANDHVDLEVYPGEVVALLGENGAGKTTLMNFVYGLDQPDEGEVWLRGERVRFTSPGDAIAARIGMVHQHFMLVQTLTVAENVILGMETEHHGVLDLPAGRHHVTELSERYGLRVDPNALVSDLSVGMQQRVEIVKALYHEADILILDEPTAVLTPQETDHLFDVLKALNDKGMAIIFITHKLREVFAIADRIVVLRHGRVVATTNPGATDPSGLATLMVGREVELRVTKTPATPGPIVLDVRSLRVPDDRGIFRVDGLSLTARAGEILGVAGVEGNGQTELVEALTGLRQPTSGQITVGGHDLTRRSPHEVIAAGVAHIPEDRQKYGLILDYSVANNLVLSRHDQEPFAQGPWLVFRAIRDEALRLIQAFDIRAPGPEVRAATLSGGNQQKTVIARELSRPVRLVIAAQPTRGLDVGSTEAVHQRLLAARDAGSAVLLVSAELDEVLALADRVAVLYHGQVVADIPSDEADRSKIGLLMAGGLERTDPATPLSAAEE